MPQRQIRLEPTDAATDHTLTQALRARLAAVRAEHEVPPEFAPEVLAEAERAAAQPVESGERDETAVPFVTLDPPGARDLDQAMHLERDGSGHRVRYAIADVPARVAPGGPLDAETRRRGQTIYCPDIRVPLHPAVLSEGAASLLPGQVRAAFVWDLRLDETGAVVAHKLYRAAVRSVEQLDYDTVQRDLDAGRVDERITLLREVGERREALERARGGASLPMPEQEARENPDGTYTLSVRPPRRVEDWNAQISLMTGMVAADLMLAAGVGLLRTMPAPQPQAIEAFRRRARALGAPWPAEMPYGEFVASLERTDPRHLALIYEATALFRGAAYTAFDGNDPQPREHAAVAAAYAHVTAPLRRLVDRFGLVVCEAASSGREVPQWCREALPTLPELMADSDRRARAVERACADAVEAAVLSPHVGSTVTAVCVDAERDRVDIHLADLPVTARASGRARPGDTLTVRLERADVASGEVVFTVV